MKKADLILIAAATVLAAVLIVISMNNRAGAGDAVEITVEGNVYSVLPLSKDTELTINSSNTLSIKDNTVRMLWADCPDGICTKHGCISRTGESIICLPNRITVTIISGGQPELDAVAR